MNKMTNYEPLFEGEPYCSKCNCKLRPLGVSTVACNHTSFTVGIDSLYNHAFDAWMVCDADLNEIIRRAA